jgi:hypothetical protein
MKARNLEENYSSILPSLGIKWNKWRKVVCLKNKMGIFYLWAIRFTEKSRKYPWNWALDQWKVATWKARINGHKVSSVEPLWVRHVHDFLQLADMCALECIQGVYNFSSQLPREQDLVALGEGSSNIFLSRSTGSGRSVGPSRQLRREPALVALGEGSNSFILVDKQRPEHGARSSASLRAGPCGSRQRVQFF